MAIAAARARGIAVANVPTDISGNADSAAELAFYMMLSLARNADDMPRQLQQRQSGRPIDRMPTITYFSRMSLLRRISAASTNVRRREYSGGL